MAHAMSLMSEDCIVKLNEHPDTVTARLRIREANRLEYKLRILREVDEMYLICNQIN